MNLQEENKISEKTTFTANDRKDFQISKEALPDNEMPFSDFISLVLHKRVAKRLNSNPKLIEKAISNLKNWLNNNPKTEAWIEWKEILENESLEKILEIITAKNDNSQRLRSSSPFAGILSKKERLEVLKICEEKRPF